MTTSYTYDGTQVDRLASFGGKAITYDANGCVNTYDDWTYTWTKGRLTKRVRGTRLSGIDTYTYTYDAYGRRTSKNYRFMKGTQALAAYMISSSTNYTYDASGRLIREQYTEIFNDLSSNSREIIYLYDENGVIGVMYSYNGSTSAAYFYRRNLQGDVTAIYNSSGSKVGEYAYDAWGNCTILSGASNDLVSNNPIRYRGYYLDSETGLYYLNARYYSPQWRRFISPDSTDYLDPESVNGLNLYAYCSNDTTKDKQGYISTSVSTISSSTSVLSSSVSTGGSVSGGNPSAPWWGSMVVGAISDFILATRYSAAIGMHSKFAYPTNTRYMYPIMGGNWRWFGKSSSSFGTVAQATFKQILTKDARAGFGAIAKSVGDVVGLSALVNFGFNFYENNWQIDSAMVIDTVIDTAIGAGSYYLAAGAMSLATAGLLAAGIALPGVFVIGGIVVLSIGFEHVIRATSGYWD